MPPLSPHTHFTLTPPPSKQAIGLNKGFSACTHVLIKMRWNDCKEKVAAHEQSIDLTSIISVAVEGAIPPPSNYECDLIGPKYFR